MSSGASVHKLLYIEDNEDNLYMLTLWFAALGGYEIISAPDGAAGIAMAAVEAPDLILMDLNLPEIDGWEATRRLKADPATRDIPIIALTRTPWRAIARRRSPRLRRFRDQAGRIRPPARQDRARAGCEGGRAGPLNPT